MNVVVNVSDAKVSNNPQAVLVTYSLGSCIGVSVYDPVVRAGGMLHYQLPSSSIDKVKSQANPMMFADTGMARLLEKLTALGVNVKRSKIVIAGGAQILNDSNLFNIGRRNQTAIRKILWQQGLLVEREDLGGNSPRTMYLDISDGSASIKSARQARAAA